MSCIKTLDNVGREIARYLSEITGFEIVESRGFNPNGPLRFQVGNSRSFETGRITPELDENSTDNSNYIGSSYIGRYLVVLSNHVTFHVFIKKDGIGVLVQSNMETALNFENFRKATRFSSYSNTSAAFATPQTNAMQPATSLHQHRGQYES